MQPLSQSHLSLLENCPRRYQYVFFDALSGPTSFDQQMRAQWGKQFHLLMQQRALNLPVDALFEADAEMAQSVAALVEAATDSLPEPSIASDSTISAVLQANSMPALENAVSVGEPFSQSEHRRTLAFNGYLLTVVYDRVVVKTTEIGVQGEILDWKTYPKPPKKAWLAQDWQTRLYLYVLCETTPLLPEQISMTYWFVRQGRPSPDFAVSSAASDSDASSSLDKPSAYRFQYSLDKHDQTRRDLAELTDGLSKMMARSHFPMVDIGLGRCDRCPFNVRCDLSDDTFGPRRSERLSPHTLANQSQHLLQTARQLNLDTVEEIPL